MCVCPFRAPVIHSGSISFYTGSSMLRVGGRLYTCTVKVPGAHVVAGIVRTASRDGFALARSPRFHGFELSIHLAGRNGIQFEILLPFFPVVFQHCVLQRAIRRFLEARRALRARQTVALSTHPRLGESSPFALLPLELLLERFCSLEHFCGPARST